MLAMAEQPALGFAGLLRLLRAEARLTQEELAKAAGLSPRSVSDLERGINRTARKDTAELLAGALDLAEPVRAVFVAAARGRAPAAQVLAAVRGQAAPAHGPAWAGCPYLGLVPFEERDARVYYGRSELAAQLVQRLVERLDGTGILLVAGESGTGKSSLLKAGLMSRLAAGALGRGSERWPRRVIRPTDSPLRELAMQLADVADAGPVSVYRSLSAAPGEAPMLVDLAVRTAAGYGVNRKSGALADAAAAAPPRLVLVVDQFEELFTAGVDTDVGRVEREAFVAALHAAATVPVGPRELPPALVVAAVRADFLGRLIAYPALKAALDAGPFTVGPMSEAELRLAITGPAAEAGLTVEPAAIEAVIAEMRDGAWGELGSGVLPLMSQAMAATWERREGNALTLRAYRRAGGVADAVNHSAQAAYDTLTSPQQDAARLVFAQLTVITPDGQFARRRCSRTDLYSPEAEMAADIDAVIDLFSAQRLLVLGQDSVEIAHDVLLQAWKQLRDWLGDDQLDRALYSQVVTDAQTWESNNRDSSYLYQPGRLATIDAATARWQDAPTRYPSLPATSQAFLAAAHHAARRTTRRRRAVIAGLVALTVIAIGAAGIAVDNAANASRQHAIALSRQLAAESLAVDSDDPLTARRLAVAAWHIFPTDQARLAMTALLIEQQQGGYMVGDPANPDVIWAAFSPNSKLLATAEADGYVRLWNLATGQAAGAPFPADIGKAGGVLEVTFSQDGKLLATADADGYLRLWNPATWQAAGAPLLAGAGPDPDVGGAAFSRDGKLLATIDGDGSVQLWNRATRQPVGAPLPAGADEVAFSPDGKLLATAGAAVELWNPATRQAVGTLVQANTSSGVAVPRANTGLAPAVNWVVTFSPDGKLLATVGDGTVQTWQLSMFADPYTALCNDVGPPTKADWTQYVPNEPQPSVCS
jgi:transcriptional regulator with XRE-family HTH domain